MICPWHTDYNIIKEGCLGGTKSQSRWRNVNYCWFISNRCLACLRMNIVFDQLKDSETPSLFFSLINISKSEILIPALLWREKHQVSAHFTFLLYRYITSQSWQCPTHPSQQNEHVPAPLHHQHHAPSQPQATAYSGDQNHEQEFNCKFKRFIKP